MYNERRILEENMSEPIHLLFSFNKNYIKPFQVLITSLLTNNPNEKFHVWLLHSDIHDDHLDSLLLDADPTMVELTDIKVDSSVFEQAHITNRYPQQMYYRLFAPQFLPKELKKVLYLDPDILIINPIRELWEIDLKENAFAAANHSGLTDIMNTVNRIRLNTDHDYFNTGVMLMDLDKARDIIDPKDIFKIVNESKLELFLPDQDVFNHLYGKYTLDLDETIWNYDARYFQQYRLRSNGEMNLDWVIENTAILHFCGKQKPWHKNYSAKFGSLYKHYMHKTNFK